MSDPRDPHADCPATYECVGCGKPICPRCDPSPREADELCGECYWIADLGPEAT